MKFQIQMSLLEEKKFNNLCHVTPITLAHTEPTAMPGARHWRACCSEPRQTSYWVFLCLCDSFIDGGQGFSLVSMIANTLVYVFLGWFAIWVFSQVNSLLISSVCVTWNLHPACRGVDANRLLWRPKLSGGLTDPGWVKLRYQLMRWYQSYPVMIYFGFFCQFAFYFFVLLSWYLPMLPRLFWISPAETSDMTFTNFPTPF